MPNCERLWQPKLLPFHRGPVIALNHAFSLYRNNNSILSVHVLTKFSLTNLGALNTAQVVVQATGKVDKRSIPLNASQPKSTMSTHSHSLLTL